MGGVTNYGRRRALKALAFWCAAELEGIEPDKAGLETLSFGSVEAMRTQLGNWDVPDRVTKREHTIEKPKAWEPAPPKRQARSSSLPEEVPDASAAAGLFKEALDGLA